VSRHKHTSRSPTCQRLDTSGLSAAAASVSGLDRQPSPITHRQTTDHDHPPCGLSLFRVAGCLWSLCPFSFLLPSFFSISFPPPQRGPSNPAKGFARSGENQICSYPTRLPGCKYIKNAFAARISRKRISGVSRAHRTCLVAANVIICMLNDI